MYMDTEETKRVRPTDQFLLLLLYRSGFSTFCEQAV